MKKITIVCLTSLLFFSACENSGSSTVGSYENEETSSSSNKSEMEGHGSPAKEHKEGTGHTTNDTIGDAPGHRSGTEIKTEGNVSADSAKSTSSPNH